MMAVVLSNMVGAVEFDVPVQDYAFEGVEENVGSEGVSLEYLPEAAALAAIDDSYGVGTSYVGIFSGIARKLPPNVNYVYWRDGRYDYRFAYGRNITLNGSVFSSLDPVVVVSYATSSSYSEQPIFSVGSDNDFRLNASSYLVYSNLGDYPCLEDGRDSNAQIVALSCVVGIGLLFVLRIFDRICR